MIRTKLLSFFSPKIYFRVCCAVLFFVAAAASFSGFLPRWRFIEADADAANVQSGHDVAMLTGSADRPYVYRHLLQDIANWGNRTTPQSVQDYLYRRVFPPGVAGEPARITAFAELPAAYRHTWFFRYLILYLLTFLSALLAVGAMYLVCDTLGLPTASCLLAPIVVILLVPYIYVFPYDYSELAFLAVAAWVALRFDWWWLLPVAALGAWNKESFLFFMFMLYPFLRLRASRRTAAVAVGVLALVCGVVYLYMRARFAHNPGSAVIVQWKDHFFTLLSGRALFTDMNETYGIPIPSASTLAPTLLLIWSFARVWKRLPAIVRKHGTFASALSGPLYLLFCTPGEYRDLSLLSIFFLLVVAWNLKDGLERPTSPLEVSETDRSFADNVEKYVPTLPVV